MNIEKHLFLLLTLLLVSACSTIGSRAKIDGHSFEHTASKAITDTLIKFKLDSDDFYHYALSSSDRYFVGDDLEINFNLSVNHKLKSDNDRKFKGYGYFKFIRSILEKPKQCSDGSDIEFYIYYGFTREERSLKSSIEITNSIDAGTENAGTTTRQLGAEWAYSDLRDSDSKAIKKAKRIQPKISISKDIPLSACLKRHLEKKAAEDITDKFHSYLASQKIGYKNYTSAIKHFDLMSRFYELSTTNHNLNDLQELNNRQKAALIDTLTFHREYYAKNVSISEVINSISRGNNIFYKIRLVEAISYKKLEDMEPSRKDDAFWNVFDMKAKENIGKSVSDLEKILD